MLDVRKVEGNLKADKMKTYFGVRVGVLGSALSLAGGVGERENDGPLVILAHLTQDCRREGAADRCRAYNTTLYFLKRAYFFLSKKIA